MINSLEDTFPFALKNYDWNNKVPIGESSFSTVYKVKVLDSGYKDQYVAIKKFVLPRVYLAYEIFIQELERLRGLKNDFIVECIDTQICQDGGYIVMELCQCDLGCYLTKFDWKIPKLVTQIIVSHIVQALSVLRKNNFYSVYVNTKNFVIKNGIVKVNPIGLGKYQVDLHESSISALPLYMAPQVIQCGDLNRTQNNSKAQIWSLGVVAYQLSIGSLPFSYQNWQTYKQKIPNQQIIIQDKLFNDSNLRDFIKICLVKQKDKRASWQQIANHSMLLKKQKPIPQSLSPQMLSVWKHIRTKFLKRKSLGEQYSIDYHKFKQIIRKQSHSIKTKQIQTIFKQYNFKHNNLILTDELIQIFEIFNIHEENQYLFMRDLAQTIRRLNINVYKISENFDSNKNKSIDYNEMKILIMSIMPQNHEAIILKVWRHLQDIHRGQITTFDMLQQLLRYLPKHQSQVMTRAQQSYYQFKKALQRQKQDLANMFHFFDLNHDNKISFRQFVPLFNSILGYQRLEQIKIIFNIVNKSKSGFITMRELKQIIKVSA